MFAETQRLARPDGASIAFHHRSAGNARGIVLIGHGLADHSRRYAAVADALSAAGFHVYAHDHRGHGKTTAADAPPGRFALRHGAETVVGDLLAMHALAASRHPALPVFLLGQAMGGLVALNAILEKPDAFAGAALWSVSFDGGASAWVTRLILRLERMFKGSDVPSDVLARLTVRAWGNAIGNTGTPFDWLSRDQQAVAAYLEDPLCGFDASVSLWLDHLDLAERGRTRLRTTQLRRNFPFHLAAGGADPATDGGKDALWLANHLKRQGFSNISTHIHSGMRHETWNDIGSDAALLDVAGWLNRLCGPQGGKAGS